MLFLSAKFAARTLPKARQTELRDIFIIIEEANGFPLLTTCNLVVDERGWTPACVTFIISQEYYVFYLFAGICLPI